MIIVSLVLSLLGQGGDFAKMAETITLPPYIAITQKSEVLPETQDITQYHFTLNPINLFDPQRLTINAFNNSTSSWQILIPSRTYKNYYSYTYFSLFNLDNAVAEYGPMKLLEIQALFIEDRANKWTQNEFLVNLAPVKVYSTTFGMRDPTNVRKKGTAVPTPLDNDAVFSIVDVSEFDYFVTANNDFFFVILRPDGRDCSPYLLTGADKTKALSYTVSGKKVYISYVWTGYNGYEAFKLTAIRDNGFSDYAIVLVLETMDPKDPRKISVSSWGEIKSLSRSQ
jgi:hypothetical protein